MVECKLSLASIAAYFICVNMYLFREANAAIKTVQYKQARKILKS